MIVGIPGRFYKYFLIVIIIGVVFSCEDHLIHCRLASKGRVSLHSHESSHVSASKLIANLSLIDLLPLIDQSLDVCEVRSTITVPLEGLQTIEMDLEYRNEVPVDQTVESILTENISFLHEIEL